MSLASTSTSENHGRSKAKLLVRLFKVSEESKIIVPEKKLIKPGWYKDIPNEEYHRGFGTSSSSLKTLLKQSPEHFDYKRKHPMKQTENMALGTAVHSLILEPNKFNDDCAVMPAMDRRTKVGKAAYAEFVASSEGKTILKESQYEQALEMAERVKEHPIAGLMTTDLIVESSVYWWYKSMDVEDDTHYKELVKIRPDGICKNYPAIIDLKTTKDGSYTGFIRSIQDYSYHLSAAMYLEGVNTCQPLLEEMKRFAFTKFVFVCVENFAPYAVSVYEISPEYLEIGKVMYRQAMMRLKEGRENDWPSYPEEIRVIEPPTYANKGWIV